MNKAQFDQIREHIEIRHQKRIAEITAIRDKELAVIELVRRLSGPVSRTRVPTPLRNVVDKMTGMFTKHDLRDYIMENCPQILNGHPSDCYLADALARYAKQGFIQVVLSGAGRRVTRYAKIEEEEVTHD